MKIIFSLIIMILFYSIYFIKMLIQKNKGIKTNQIGLRKEKKLHNIEMTMKALTIIIVLVQLFSIIFQWTYLNNPFSIIGFVIGLIGDFIFLLAVLQMKDNWRAGIPLEDKTNLVTEGIYKISRNPAFLGFDLMYIGLLLLNFNILNLIITISTIIILHLQILQEEQYMIQTFNDQYLNYKRKVNRYFGRKIRN